MRAALNLKKDPLVHRSFWLFAAMMTANIFNYAFQLIMGRLMPTAQYGLLNATLALLVVLGVPVATIFMFVSKKAGHLKAIGNAAAVRRLFLVVSRKTFFWGLAGLTIFALFSQRIGVYLREPSLYPVLWLGVCALTALIVPINMAVLQGLQDYKWFGINLAIPGPLRVALGIPAVLLGWGVSGVLGALALGNSLLYLTSYLPLRRHLISNSHGSSKEDALSFAEAFPALLANLAFAIMTQADMVLVNRYFTPEQSGLYASAAILGRTVMYLPGAVVMALFPMVSENTALNRGSRHLLARALALTLGFSIPAAAVFYFLPGLSLRLLFGARYSGATPVLRYFGLAMLPLALITVLMNYRIAQGRTFFSYIMAAGALLEVLTIWFFHQSLINVVFIILGSGSLVAIGGLIA